MNIEKEIEAIAEKKEGNTEMAFFYDNEYSYDEGNWKFLLGNPSQHVMLGEVEGEIEVYGNSLKDVINKMNKALTNERTEVSADKPRSGNNSGTE